MLRQVAVSLGAYISYSRHLSRGGMPEGVSLLPCLPMAYVCVSSVALATGADPTSLEPLDWLWSILQVDVHFIGDYVYKILLATPGGGGAGA